MNLLNVDSISKTFTIHILSGKIIEGFKDVSFTVPRGTALGISGPSGSGKSSVLKCIYGSYLTTRGDIWYESPRFGRLNLTRSPLRTINQIREMEIGYITQFLKVIPRVSALDIVSAPLMEAGAFRKAARSAAGDLLEQLGIPQRLFEAYPATFSGGEQQRVNIARAIIKAPHLLILDEPTACLDADTTSVVLDILLALREKGTTMIGIFHQPEILARFSDAIYRMKTDSDRGTIQ